MHATHGPPGLDATISQLVDLDRYPLTDLGSGDARSLVAHAQDQLRTGGACELPGFLRPDGLAACRRDAEALEPLAHRSHGDATPYLEQPDGHWPADRPRWSWNPFALGVVAYDQFPSDSPSRAIYEWEPFREFVAAVLGGGPVYRYADPLGALNLATMIEGDELEWHFDQTDFVVSLALQSSDRGGDFEVVPHLRSADDECYEQVARVLAGDHPGVVTLPMTPGTLLIFAGRHSIHRVSPVIGATSRLVLLMGFDTKAGTVSSPLLQQSRYGRVAA